MTKLEDTDFFDKGELRRAGRQVKSLDDPKPKKRHLFAKFLLVILILIIASGCVYYFVIDTPKTFYTKISEKISHANKYVDFQNNNNLNYSLDTSIKSNDKEAKKTLDVLNEIELSGTIKLENKELTGSNNIKYKGEDLVDLTYLLDTNENMAYLKLDKVLDSTIKMDLNDEEDEEKPFSTNKEDYETVFTSFMQSFKESLENANYERKITKLNKYFVFKDTILLDENFEKDLYTKLLHDDDFLRALSKIDNKSVSEISDQINEEISNLEKEKSELSIYRIPIKNEILKIEIFDEEDNITIEKEKDTYNYDIKTKKGNTYKGYLKINKVNDETKITFNYEEVKEALSITVNLAYSKNEFKIDTIDKDKAIEYTELTEQDMIKVSEYMTKNKTFNILLDDLDFDNPLSETEDVSSM